MGVTCTPPCTPPADHWATGRRHGASAKRKAPSSSRKDALDLSTGPLSVAAPMAVAGEAAMQAVGGVSRAGRPRLGGELRGAHEMSPGKGGESKCEQRPRRTGRAPRSIGFALGRFASVRLQNHYDSLRILRYDSICLYFIRFTYVCIGTIPKPSRLLFHLFYIGLHWYDSNTITIHIEFYDTIPFV